MLIDEFKSNIITPAMKRAAFHFIRKKHRQAPLGNLDDAIDDKANIEDYELKPRLAKLGWFKGGAGVYSTVYVNRKKPFVLKINKYPDKAYAKYVQIIKNHPNIHFPKISDMKTLTIDGETYYIYLIEKLEKIPAAQAARYVKIFKLYILNKRLQSSRILLKNPDLAQALSILAKNERDENKLDLHSSNIMRRNDGVVVFTDPYQ